MPFDAGSVVSTFGLDMNPFAQGMLQATSLAQVFPSTVTQFLANPLLALIGIAEQVGSALENTFLKVGHATDELAKDAAKAGVSVEFLSGIGSAFVEAGSSVGGLSEALKFLSRNASDAAMGNKAAEEAFGRLGIGVDTVRANLGDAGNLLFVVADQMAKLPTVTERTGAAMALLSRGGADAVAALSQGSGGLRQFAAEIQQLGGVTDTSLAKSGLAFGTLSHYIDAAETGIEHAAARPLLAALEAHFESVKVGIFAASEAINTHVNSAVQGMVDFVQAHGPQIESAFQHIASGIVTAFGFIQQHSRAIEIALAALGGIILGPVVAGAFAALAAAVAFVGPELVAGGAAVGLLTGAFAGFAATGGKTSGILSTLGGMFQWVRGEVSQVYTYAVQLAGQLKGPLLEAFDAIRPALHGAGVLAASTVPLFEALYGATKALALLGGAALVTAFQAVIPVLKGVATVIGYLQEVLAKTIKTIGELGLAATDMAGITDPNKRFGNPYAKQDRRKQFADEHAPASDDSTANDDSGDGDDQDVKADSTSGLPSGVAAAINAALAQQPAGAQVNVNLAQGAGGGSLAASLPPDTFNAVKDASKGLADAMGDFSRNVMLDLFGTFKKLGLAANNFSGAFDDLAGTLSQLDMTFNQLVGNLRSGDATALGGGGARNVQNINVGPVNVPPFDVNAATSQIAAKLGPVLRDAFAFQQQQISAAAASVRVGRGL